MSGIIAVFTVCVNLCVSVAYSASSLPRWSFPVPAPATTMSVSMGHSASSWEQTPAASVSTATRASAVRRSSASTLSTASPTSSSPPVSSHHRPTSAYRCALTQSKTHIPKGTKNVIKCSFEVLVLSITLVFSFHATLHFFSLLLR